MCRRLSTADRRATAVRRVRARARAREAVELAADEVPRRVAAERERREADHVREQHERAEADAELVRAVARLEEEGADGVVPEEAEHDDREVEEVAVRVLEDQRQPALAAVALSARRPRRPAARGRTSGSRPCGSSNKWPAGPAAPRARAAPARTAGRRRTGSRRRARRTARGSRRRRPRSGSATPQSATTSA